MPSQNLLDWNNHTVKIPKIGKVSFRNSKAPKWYKNRTRVCNITVSKVPLRVLREPEESSVKASEKKLLNISQNSLSPTEKMVNLALA